MLIYFFVFWTNVTDTTLTFLNQEQWLKLCLFRCFFIFSHCDFIIFTALDIQIYKFSGVCLFVCFQDWEQHHFFIAFSSFISSVCIWLILHFLFTLLYHLPEKVTFLCLPLLSLFSISCCLQQACYRRGASLASACMCKGKPLRLCCAPWWLLSAGGCVNLNFNKLKIKQNKKFSFSVTSATLKCTIAAHDQSL